MNPRTVVISAIAAIGVVMLVMIAWVEGIYCAENDISLSQQVYADCMKGMLSSGPLCSRTAKDVSCKRWARW
jgi:hypothetical protein